MVVPISDRASVETPSCCAAIPPRRSSREKNFGCAYPVTVVSGMTTVSWHRRPEASLMLSSNAIVKRGPAIDQQGPQEQISRAGDSPSSASQKNGSGDLPEPESPWSSLSYKSSGC